MTDAEQELYPRLEGERDRITMLTGGVGARRRHQPDGAGPGGRLHLTDHPGRQHGFPDDSRIYERLAPLLASTSLGPGRRSWPP
jgi:hypothetical protein